VLNRSAMLTQLSQPLILLSSLHSPSVPSLAEKKQESREAGHKNVWSRTGDL